ncbi:MAG TPA: SIS domain-containing protein [Candidatus Lokiarchaeia archaeon]|nr:SIS domain-containing protein [Candidatus Lokiarchaeia archaeon]
MEKFPPGKISTEIMAQYEALKQTFAYFDANAQKIKDFMETVEKSNWIFIGCGSSYSLCIAGELVTLKHLKHPAFSIAAGDLLLNFPQYAELIKDSLIIAPSRSGETTEVNKAIELAKTTSRCKVASICTKENAPLSILSDIDLVMPWAFDDATCQTRTVTNLYAAILMLVAIAGEDQDLLDEIKEAIDIGDQFMDENAGVIMDFVEQNDWERVVVLADAELAGIAQEGMIAFMEISRVPANYFHILDVRHGPIIMIGKDTLIVMACSQHNEHLQVDLVANLKEAGATIACMSENGDNPWNADLHVTIPPYQKQCVRGIPFIFIIQMLAYRKALKRGVDPDAPPGLKPWITLNL